jgi:hypothetical protein
MIGRGIISRHLLDLCQSVFIGGSLFVFFCSLRVLRLRFLLLKIQTGANGGNGEESGPQMNTDETQIKNKAWKADRGANQVLTMIPNSEVGTARRALPQADLRPADRDIFFIGLNLCSSVPICGFRFFLKSNRRS